MDRSVSNILKALNQAESRTITVFGDYCLDKYLYIDPTRNEDSVETGLQAYQVYKKALFPGVGGTIASNLCALGVRVHCVGLVGDDGEGYDLIKGLDLIGAETDLMVRAESIMTGTYIKPMLANANDTYTEMNRLDIRNFMAIPSELGEQLLENLEKALEVSQGVVVSDQFLENDGSAVTSWVRCEIAKIAKRYPEKYFVVDSRGFADRYHDVIVKCNQFELPGIIDDGDRMNKGAILSGGKELLSSVGRAVVVTVGSEGAYVFEGDSTVHIPPFSVDGPLDIVGAGDATNAGMILGLTLGLSLSEAVLLGGCISSITIQQLGVTGSATIEQIRERLQNFTARK